MNWNAAKNARLPFLEHTRQELQQKQPQAPSLPSEQVITAALGNLV
jgi:hypothetical protein